MARRTWGWAVVVLAWLASAVHAQSVKEQLDRLIDSSTYKHGRWGVLVVDADNGQVIYERLADQMFAPASTTKIYSCSCALNTLGPDFRFRTPIYRRGEVVKGVLKGDLILKASGDLTLGGRTLPDGTMAFANNDHTYADNTTTYESLTPTDPLAGLKNLARHVRASGIERVQGEVLIDARFFEAARSSGSGPAQVTPIVVNDNVIDVIITPADKPDQPALVTTRPATPLLGIDAQVMTRDGGALELDVVSAGPTRISVRGKIPLKSKPQVRIVSVENPVSWARALLIEQLQAVGIAVKAQAYAEPAEPLPDQKGYGSLASVAEFQSPPLSELIKVTLKVSHNLYASTLPLLVASHHGERTLAEGMKRQKAFLQDMGVDVNAVSFAGGAGGASADATTPRATVTLLQGLLKKPYFGTFEKALPILGVDGTLATVVTAESPARGKVFAKTGTLWWTDLLNDRSLLRSKALAGTMTTAQGRRLVFAMFINDLPLPAGVTPSREGKALGKACEILYQAAP